MMKGKILAILFIFATCVLPAVAIEKVKIGDLYYNLNPDDRTAEVTSQNNSSPRWTTNITTANIPASIEYNSTTYSVTSIGWHAFFECSSLTSVTIPNSVTSIGKFAFNSCTGLTSISVASRNSYYSSSNGVLFNYSKTTLIQYPERKSGSYSIPNSVTSIGDWAFDGCSGLTSIMISNSVTSIGEFAFCDCTGLSSVTIPNSVTSIGNHAFDACRKLTSIMISNSVTSIGKCAFYNCSSLTSVTIPNSVTSIGDWAFEYCTGLTSVTIPNSVTSIGKNAFGECANLKEIRYPRGLKLSKAGIPSSTKLIAYSPTNSSTSTATASSRSTSDTNSATTPQTAATQPSNPTTKSGSSTPTIPAKLPECRIEYSRPENIYHSSSIRLCYSVDSKLSDNQEIEFLIDGTPVKPRMLSQQKGVRPVQCTEVELDSMPTIANHVTKVSIRIVDKSLRMSWSEKSIALIYQSVHKPTLHVFAVGVNKYKAEGFDELRYAEKDACDFSKTIIDIADKNMYERVDTTVILGSRANRKYILEQLMKLEGRVKSNDIVMLFFSGHGKVENNKSYFITSEAEYVIQGLATRDIVDQIELMKKRSNVFVFMDACHSGATKTTERTKGNAKPITLAESEVIGYYSCAEKQESIEDENLKNGVFTYALVKGLKGTDANEEQITIYELAEDIRKWVREKTNGRQSPTLDYQGDDYVIFYKKK